MKGTIFLFFLSGFVALAIVPSCSENSNSSATDMSIEPPAIDGTEFSDAVKKTMEITNDPTGLNIILICGKGIAKSHLVGSRDDGENDDWADRETIVDSLFTIVKGPDGKIDLIYEHHPGEFRSSLKEGRQVHYFENKNATDDFSLVVYDKNDGFSAASETHNIVKLPDGRFLDLWTQNIHLNDIFEMRRAAAIKSKCSKYAQKN